MNSCGCLAIRHAVVGYCTRSTCILEMARGTRVTSNAINNNPSRCFMSLVRIKIDSKSNTNQVKNKKKSIYDNSSRHACFLHPSFRRTARSTFSSSSGSNISLENEKAKLSTTAKMSAVANSDTNHHETGSLSNSIVEAQTVNDKLYSASEEAKRLLLLLSAEITKKSKTTAVTMKQVGINEKTQTGTTTSPYHININACIGATDSLLAVTNEYDSLADIILQRRSSDKVTEQQIACIHNAFVALVSWCLDNIIIVAEASKKVNKGNNVEVQSRGNTASTIATDDIYNCNFEKQQMQIFLIKALELARRAHHLFLPLHLPLYERLAATVAKLYVDKTNAASSLVPQIILEISSWVTSNLDTPVGSEFFAESILALLRQKRLTDALILIRGMDEGHAVRKIDPETTEKILLALQETYLNKSDEDDFLDIDPSFEELIDYLDLSSSKSFQTFYSLIRYHVEDIEIDLDELKNMEYDDEDDYEEDDDEDDDYYDDEDDEDDSDNEYGEEDDSDDEDDDEEFKRQIKSLIRNHIERLPVVSSESAAQKSNFASIQSGEDDKKIGDGMEYNSGKQRRQRELDSELKSIIYSRDEDDSVLAIIPDITSQVMKLNGGRRLRYTDEFEDAILAQVFLDSTNKNTDA